MSDSETSQPSRTKHVLKDLTGLTFGTVRVIERAAQNYTKNKACEAQWVVECANCHRQSTVRGSQLRGGRVTGKRCIGCKQIELDARKDAPALIIDASFVREWTGMVLTAAAQMLGGWNKPLFQALKDDVLSETMFALSKVRGVPPGAMTTFVFRTARTIAINKLKKALNAPQLIQTASEDPDAPGSYEFRLNLLTDRVPEFQVDADISLMAEAFAELPAEEQEFCKEYAALSGPKERSSQQRMYKIRRRLRERLSELSRGNPSQEVHEQQ